MLSFINSILAYPAALVFVFRHGLTRYFLISGLISLILGALAVASVYYLADDLGAQLMNWYPFQTGRDTVDKIAIAMGGVAITGIAFFIYKYALLILIGPFMGPLSERVEAIETGLPASQQGLGSVGYAFVRGIRLAVRNVLREIYLTLILLLIGLIPLLTPFTTAAIFLLQSYYMGFGNTDYHLEKNLNVKQSISYCRTNRFSVMGNGVAYILILLIPVVGLIIAPVLGTVAATRQALGKT